jgi:hypothetical protein
MRWILLMAGLAAPFAVSAAKLETHSKMESVTLSPNTALVSRVAEVELPAGGLRHFPCNWIMGGATGARAVALRPRDHTSLA